MVESWDIIPLIGIHINVLKSSTKVVLIIKFAEFIVDTSNEDQWVSLKKKCPFSRSKSQHLLF